MFWTVYEWDGVEKQAVADYDTERAALDAAGLPNLACTSKRHLF